jgi:hypothetical protein
MVEENTIRGILFIMADKERWNLDSDDFGTMNPELLKDVHQATQQVKQQRAKDKAREKKAEIATKDRGVVYAIVAVAVVIIFALAYWNTFMRGSTPESSQPRAQSQTSTTQPQNTTAQPRVATPQAAPANQGRIYQPAPVNTMPRQAPPRYSTPAQAPGSTTEDNAASNSAENPDAVGM